MPTFDQKLANGTLNEHSMASIHFRFPLQSRSCFRFLCFPTQSRLRLYKLKQCETVLNQKQNAQTKVLSRWSSPYLVWPKSRHSRAPSAAGKALYGVVLSRVRPQQVLNHRCRPVQTDAAGPFYILDVCYRVHSLRIEKNVPNVNAPVLEQQRLTRTGAIMTKRYLKGELQQLSLGPDGAATSNEQRTDKLDKNRQRAKKQCNTA